MRTFILPTQDASIYQRFPDMNSGLDEVLEIGKLTKTTDGRVMYASSSVRTLLDFDINVGDYDPNSQYYLNLFLAKADKLNRYQTIEIYPISTSWIEGSGYFYQDVKNTSDGVSWKYTNKNTLWTNLGGDYDTNISSSYTFSSIPAAQTIKINITSLISPVVSGSNTTPWNGLLLKFPDADEIDQENVGNIRVFSMNTHTIFSPNIEIVKADQQFYTGSLKPIPTSNVSIIPKTLKQSYTRGEVDKIYLVVRDLYPDKRFDSRQRYRNMYYLPSESYFRIRDVVSGVEIHSFDQYSAINCDASGSYIILTTDGLQTNRYYSLDLKIKSNNLVFYPSIEYVFRVEDNNSEDTYKVENYE